MFIEGEFGKLKFSFIGIKKDLIDEIELCFLGNVYIDIFLFI